MKKMKKTKKMIQNYKTHKLITNYLPEKFNCKN